MRLFVSFYLKIQDCLILLHYSITCLSLPKVYCIDNGLVNAVSFKFSENIGKAMENLVAVELLRRGEEFYYWQDSSGKEIDFVVKDDMEIKQLIQVCYNVENPSTHERELRSLFKSSGKLKCNDLLVITNDYKGEEEYKGIKIKFISLWEWLLLNHI